MDCTTALMELPNGNLIRRKAWQDGEYISNLYSSTAKKLTTQHQNGQSPEDTFLQGRHTCGQQAH